jgi:hypothetical protein
VRSARAGAVALSGFCTFCAFCVFCVVPASALLTGCSAGGTGTRDEGPARTDRVGRAYLSPTPTAVPSPVPSPVPGRVDAVHLVRDDPKVSPKIKRALKRCPGDAYPVDVSYGRLTGGPVDDVVVNVMTCDAVGVGSYVYRATRSAARPSATSGTVVWGATGRGDDGYVDVFRDEQPPVYAEIDRGDLVVTQKTYEKDDPITSPSSEDVITYHWSASGHRFAEQDRTHNDYSDAVGGDTSSTDGSGN